MRIFYLFLSIFLLQVISTPLFGTSYTFIGGGGDELYTNVNNWEGVNYPGLFIHADDTIIINADCDLVTELLFVDGRIEIPGNNVKLKGATDNTGDQLRIEPNATMVNNGIVEVITNVSYASINGNGRFYDLYCENCTIEAGSENTVGHMSFGPGKLEFYRSKLRWKISSDNLHDRFTIIEPLTFSQNDEFVPRVIHIDGYLPDNKNLNSFLAIETNKSPSFGEIFSPSSQVSYEGENLSDGFWIHETANYKFVGGTGDSYIEEANWLDDSDFVGYPGTDVARGTIFSDAKCVVPTNVTLNLACRLDLDAELENNGIINYSRKLEGEPSTTIYSVINNTNAQFNLSGKLSLDADFINMGAFNIQGSSASLSSRGGISTLINQEAGIISNEGTIMWNVDIENYGLVKTYNRIESDISGDGIIEGDGFIQDITCEGCTIRPGGLNEIGSFNIYDLVLSGNSIIEMKVPEIYNDVITILGSISGELNEFKIIKLGNYLEHCDSNVLFCAIHNFPQITVQGFTSSDWVYDNGVFKLHPEGYGNHALDFGLASDPVSELDYASVLENLGEIKTIEFKFFPEKIGVSEPGGMIFYVVDDTDYIFQGSYTGSIPDETLSILHNGKVLYITTPLERRWYHVSITSDGNGFYDKIYLDGVAQTTSAPNGLPATYTMNEFYIGARIGTSFSESNYRGRMDEIRLWSVPRTQELIEQNWNKELQANDYTGLEAYYKMNQGFAYDNNDCVDHLLDYSGNKNNGVLSDEFDLMGDNKNWVNALGCPSSAPKQVNHFVGNGSDWFDENNWSLGVPTICHKAIIPNGKNVVVNGLGAVCYTLTVEDNATIDIDLVTTLETTAPLN